MNEAAAPPKYLAVAPVARVVEFWVCKSVAIIIGEYARAADAEIISLIDLSGKYDAYTSEAYTPVSYLTCDVMQMAPGKHKPFKEYCESYKLYDEMQQPSFLINIYKNEESIDRFSISAREFNNTILTQKVMLIDVYFWLPIVKVINLRIQRAAIDYL